MTQASRGTVAVYLRYFLSPSETFVYRQLQGVSDAFRPIVLTAEHRNAHLFPCEDIYVQGKSAVEKALTRMRRMVTRRFTALTGAQVATWGQALASNDARLIHAHFGHYGLDILPIAKQREIPLLVTFHGYDASFLLRNSTYVKELGPLGEYATVIMVSRNMVERMAAVGFRPGRVHVHYIGVPVGDFSFVERKPVASKLADREPLNFLQVSNFEKKKGHEYTIEAFARYSASHPSATLTLAGDGPRRVDMEALVSQKGLGNRVSFEGLVDRDGVARLMSKADVFVHHSVTPEDGSMEGLPTVLMEAMATGLPVLSSIHAGIPELVADGIDGFLVAERDVDAYVDRMDALVTLDRESGKRARAKIENTFNMKTQNEKLIDIYRGAIDANVV